MAVSKKSLNIVSSDSMVRTKKSVLITGVSFLMVQLPVLEQKELSL